MLRTVWFMFLSCRLRRNHYKWGNMLAMDQGVVEEWLSEFKVCVCFCPSKKISVQVNEFAVFQPLTCVTDSSWQCHIQLCRLIKRQSSASSRTVQGHQGELQWCMNTCFYICVYFEYCQLCCMLHMTSWRKISKGPWLASSFSSPPSHNGCNDGCIVLVFGPVFPLSCWNQSATSYLSFTGAANHSCSALCYSSCLSSCGASCPSAQPETPTLLDA